MLKTIYTSTVPIDCHIIKGRLESEGICTFIYDENLIWIHPFKSVALGGVKLKVPSDQFDIARHIIDSIAVRKLIDSEGEYDLSEAIDESFKKQNEILELKYKIRNNETILSEPQNIRSDTLDQSEIDNLIAEELKFKEEAKKVFIFSWNIFFAELFDFEGKVFEYLHPRSVEFYMDKEMVDLYKCPLPDTEEKICPNCNSDNVSYGYAIDYKWDLLYLILSFFLITPFPPVRKNCHCFNCGNDFKRSKKLK